MVKTPGQNNKNYPENFTIKLLSTVLATYHGIVFGFYPI